VTGPDAPGGRDRLAETRTVVDRFQAGVIGEADALVAIGEIWAGMSITYQGRRSFLYDPWPDETPARPRRPREGDCS
jgi:hypothetical protein